MQATTITTTYKVKGQGQIIARAEDVPMAVAFFANHRAGVDVAGQYIGTDFSSSDLLTKVLLFKGAAGKPFGELAYNGRVTLYETTEK